MREYQTEASKEASKHLPDFYLAVIVNIKIKHKIV